MDCKNLRFSEHANERMLEREIASEDVLAVVGNGETIEDYPGDRPYPSRLLLAFLGGMPLHVVVSKDESTGTCFIITAYVPEPELWDQNFRKRRKP
ncbi:MAG: DUF4258 domain-containing protein [Leptospirales bacterium]